MCASLDLPRNTEPNVSRGFARDVWRTFPARYDSHGLAPAPACPRHTTGIAHRRGALRGSHHSGKMARTVHGLRTASRSTLRATVDRLPQARSAERFIQRSKRESETSRADRARVPALIEVRPMGSRQAPTICRDELSAPRPQADLGAWRFRGSSLTPARGVGCAAALP